MNFGKSTTDKVTDEVSKRGTQLANGIEGAADSVHDVAQETLSNVSGKIDTLRDQVKPSIDRLMARGEEIVGNVATGTRESGRRVKQAASRYVGSCESYVTEQPIKAIAIAAAAGATIAALLMVSRNRATKRDRFNAR